MDYSLLSMLNVFSVLFFIVSFSSILLGVIVVSKYSKDMVNKLLFLLSLVFFIGCFGYGMAFWTYNKEEVYLFIGIASIGYCLLWPVGAHFFCEFMFGHTSKRMKIIIFTLYCVALFYIITWFTGLTASTDFIKMKYGWLDVPNKSIFYYIYILYTLVCYLLIFYLFFKARIVYRKQVYRNGFSEKLQQINILITGALLSASFGLFFNIIAPNLKNPLPSIGFLFLEFYIGSAFYCIFRYKSFILEDKIAPYVMEFLGETIVVIDENIRTVYVNDSFFNILNIDKCSHELIYLPDFIKSDTQEIIDFSKPNLL